MVVPQLFANLETPAIAGRMAAKLFSTQTWLSCACALVLLMAARARHEQEGEDRLPSSMAGLTTAILWPVLGMMLALISEFAIAPRIVARENLALWHGLGSGLYLMQWLTAGWALFRQVWR